MLTRDEFQTISDQGQDAVFALFSTLQEQVALLSAQVKELEDREGKDSHNSHQPPSSDELSKKPVSLRPHTGLTVGAGRGSGLAVSARLCRSRRATTGSERDVRMTKVK